MKISVALCTYNGANYINSQLLSILQQSHPVDEIVVCDDGSTDETISIVEKFNDTYPGIIQLYVNDINIGVVKNFEKAIKYCTGDILFLSDQDDIWEANKVNQTLEYFAANDNIYGCFSDAFIIDENNVRRQKTLWQSILFNGTLPANKLFAFLLEYRNPVTGACLAIKKEAIPLIFPIEKNGNMLHDEWFGLKLSEKNLLGCINKPLIQYRVHAGQQTGLPRENYDDDYLSIRAAIFKNNFSEYPLYQYFHWMRKLKHLPNLKKYFSVPTSISEEIKNFRDKSLSIYLATQPYFKKKALLLKWYIKQDKDITLKEVFTL